MSLYRQKECYFYTHFHNKSLKDELDLVDLGDLLQISKQNLNLSFELFNQNIESLLKTYYPKTIASSTKLKEGTKPWMKSITVINKIYSFAKPLILTKKKFQKKKRFKVHRNHVVILSRFCKENYYKEYFKDNRKNAKKSGMELDL